MSRPPDGSSFRLEIRATVVRVGPHGAYTNDRLEISDTLNLDVADFLGISKVLGRFHDLAEELRARGEPGR